MRDSSFWPLPADNTGPGLYLWARRLVDLMRRGEYRDYVVGSVTLTAGTSTTVTQTNMLTTSMVLFSPTNSAARALGIPAVTTKTQGTGFGLTHAAAAGTETYDYQLIR